MTYSNARRKLKREQMLMAPFVWLGRIWGKLFPLKNKYGLFLFYPSADIGGSPQVNIDIAQCTRADQPLIIFSKRPRNNGFRDRFNIEGVDIMDLSARIDYKVFHFVNFFYRGVIASWIRQSGNPPVLGGECLFFYKVIPHLDESVRSVEVCHLPTWLDYTLGFAERINFRVFSTERLRESVREQYLANHIPQALFARLFFVESAIDIPDYTSKPRTGLEVVFIGRGSPQKRVHLVAEMAETMHQAKDPVRFSFVGDVENSISLSKYPYCRFYGNIREEKELKTIYENADVLILTSSSEGLPIVVMTMMAYGKVVLSTAVNGIPDYIHHMENGLLITAKDEAAIVAEGVALLRQLIRDPDLKMKLGRKNRQIAIEIFSKARFCKRFKEILLEKPAANSQKP
jgi:glycosyltransferase involved in cell wall biosynthesis